MDGCPNHSKTYRVCPCQQYTDQCFGTSHWHFVFTGAFNTYINMHICHYNTRGICCYIDAMCYSLVQRYSRNNYNTVLYSQYYMLYSQYYILYYTVNTIYYTIQSILYTIQSILYTIQSVLYTIQSTLYTTSI